MERRTIVINIIYRQIESVGGNNDWVSGGMRVVSTHKEY